MLFTLVDFSYSKFIYVCAYFLSSIYLSKIYCIFLSKKILSSLFFLGLDFNILQQI